MKIAFLGLTSLLIWQFKAISVDLSSLVIVLLYLSRNHMMLHHKISINGSGGENEPAVKLELKGFYF